MFSYAHFTSQRDYGVDHLTLDRPLLPVDHDSVSRSICASANALTVAVIPMSTRSTSSISPARVNARQQGLLGNSVEIG
jgi:hypothetical protein